MCAVASAGSWAGRPVSESGGYVKLPRWGPMRPGPRTSLMLATLEKYKDSRAAANGRGTAVKPRRSAARNAAYRPARVSHAR